MNYKYCFLFVWFYILTYIRCCCCHMCVCVDESQTQSQRNPWHLPVNKRPHQHKIDAANKDAGECAPLFVEHLLFFLIYILYNSYFLCCITSKRVLYLLTGYNVSSSGSSKNICDKQECLNKRISDEWVGGGGGSLQRQEKQKLVFIFSSSEVGFLTEQGSFVAKFSQLPDNSHAQAPL